MKYLFIIAALSLLVACNETKDNSKAEKVKTEIDQLNDAIENNDLSAEPYLKRAKYYVGKRQMSLAKSDFETAVKLEPENASALLQLAEVLFQENNTRGSKDLLYRSIQADSSNTDAYLKLGELYMYLAQYDSTFKYVNIALKKDDEIAKAYFLKGMAYKYSKNIKFAKSSFQTTVELDPDYYHAFIQLGELYAEENDPIAVSYYQNALSINPNSVEALYHMGYFLQTQLDTAGAVQAYEAIRSLDSNNTDALYNLGYIEFEIKGNTERAKSYFQEVLKIRRSHSKALYMVGLCFESLGEFNKAQSYYQESSTSNPAFELPKIGLQRLKSK